MPCRALTAAKTTSLGLHVVSIYTRTTSRARFHNDPRAPHSKYETVPSPYNCLGARLCLHRVRPSSPLYSLLFNPLSSLLSSLQSTLLSTFFFSIHSPLYSLLFYPLSSLYTLFSSIHSSLRSPL